VFIAERHGTAPAQSLLATCADARLIFASTSRQLDLPPRLIALNPSRSLQKTSSQGCYGVGKPREPREKPSSQRNFKLWWG
jgi:hypothetical protein